VPLTLSLTLSLTLPLTLALALTLTLTGPANPIHTMQVGMVEE
jgi:hypothetical protein